MIRSITSDLRCHTIMSMCLLNFSCSSDVGRGGLICEVMTWLYSMVGTWPDGERKRYMFFRLPMTARADERQRSETASAFTCDAGPANSSIRQSSSVMRRTRCSLWCVWSDNGRIEELE
jgi:hypothetical protein